MFGINNKNLVEFMSIDLSKMGDTVYYFVNTGDPNSVADTPELAAVAWNGNTWTPLPFESTAWKRGGEEAESPQINMPDFGGLMALKLKQTFGGTGAAVTRYNVLNPKASNGGIYTVERYLLSTYQATGKTLQLQLATQFNFTKSQIPNFVMTRDRGYPGLGSALRR